MLLPLLLLLLLLVAAVEVATAWQLQTAALSRRWRGKCAATQMTLSDDVAGSSSTDTGPTTTTTTSSSSSNPPATGGGSGSAFRYQQPETKAVAYSEAAALNVKMPVIILVSPYLDQNVGSVSRAMLNFGLHELRVVDPRCDILSDNARALAAGSVEILENAKVYATCEECLADLQRVFATTVRPRHMTQVILTPGAAAEAALAPAAAAADSPAVRVGIMFGRERSGLTNEEVALSDSIISIPSFKYFSSLNLAQAVNIVGFELWKRNLDLSEQRPPEVWLHPKEADRLARRAELDLFLDRLESALDAKEHQKHPEIRAVVYRSIRSIFQRTLLSKAEVDVMHGVLSTLTKQRLPRGAGGGGGDGGANTGESNA